MAKYEDGIQNQYNTVIINPVMPSGQDKNANIKTKLDYAGFNTGNVVFADSIKKQLNYTREIWKKDNNSMELSDISDIKNPSVIMPSSNFIIHDDNNELAYLLCDFMEKNNCPITLVGLGAQSTPEFNTPKKLVSVLSKEKKRWFKMLSERAVSIGIRGEFTAECLEEMGIYNYRIIGCPSIYKYLDGKFSILPKPTLKNIQITVTAGSVRDTKILEMGYKKKSHWIMQMITEFPEVVFEDKELKYDKLMWSFPALSISEKRLIKYMKKRAHMFYTLEDWDEFYKKNKITFAFGSRFHGNMAALRNGVPTLWIVHDSRTTELVNTLHLPKLEENEFMKIRNMKELINYCNYDDFYENYSVLHKNYIEFLEENHISHKFFNNKL